MGILHHELWRDEANVWLRAWDADSWSSFVASIKDDGHPWLWYVVVYGVYQITTNPLAMQFFHLGIAVFFSYVWLSSSPFSRLHQILVCFGYYCAYEYALISRNYAFGILGVFLFCALFETRRRTYVGLALSLALMMQANIYAMILAIAAILALCVDYGITPDPWLKTRRRWVDLVLSIAIVAIVGWQSLQQMIPSEAGNYASGWVVRFNGLRVLEALSKLWSSYVLLITPQNNYQDLILLAIASLILFFIFAQSLRHTPVALIFYLVANLGIFCFSYLKFMGAIRHVGHLAIALIVALWIADYYPDSRCDPTQSPPTARPWQKLASTTLTIILSSQAIAGILAMINDLRYPFSAGQATAHYLQAEQLDDALIVGSPDYTMSPIALYLKRQIYYPELQRLGSFTRYTTDRNPVDQPTILAQLITLFRHQPQSEIILILNQPLRAEHPDLCIQPLTELTESLIHDEKFYLYRVEFQCAAAPVLP
ncbi:hypothetical protein [Spirulina major]|uniref:hypothetical protein n=1 Tax=Spirulina major TaxID=270636 RepID=UPI001114BBE8|nr:hypothetical protein [Spirulina major]